jgi:hypothetical protein
MDAQGQPVLAPRYVPPAHIEINDAMTSVALYVAKASNDILSEWRAAEEALKNAITKSMGPMVRNIVEHPEHGFSLLNIMRDNGSLTEQIWPHAEEYQAGPERKNDGAIGINKPVRLAHL